MSQVGLFCLLAGGGRHGVAGLHIWHPGTRRCVHHHTNRGEWGDDATDTVDSIGWRQYDRCIHTGAVAAALAHADGGAYETAGEPAGNRLNGCRLGVWWQAITLSL